LPCWAGYCPVGLVIALLGWLLPCWAGYCPVGLVIALLGWLLPRWAGYCPDPNARFMLAFKSDLVNLIDPALRVANM